MPRYVAANRRAARFTDERKRAARDELRETLRRLDEHVTVVHDTDPTDPHARRIVVFDADPHAVASHVHPESDHVVVEREIRHKRWQHRPAQFLSIPTGALSGPAGKGVKLHATVTGDGEPLVACPVLLFLRGPGGLGRLLPAMTGRTGRVAFEFGPIWRTVALVAAPASGRWSMTVRAPETGLAIDCPRLPTDGPLGWWHHEMGIGRSLKTRGRGVRVGVMDSGVAPHPNLAHVRDLGAVLDGAHDPDDGDDVESHGTHVCGVIGARPLARGEYGGIAPGVRLSSVRVTGADGAANQADMATALDLLSGPERADLVNISLGDPEKSHILHDAVQDALERGTLCVCAAANDGGAVQYPAALDETVAVSAFGRLGWGPPGGTFNSKIPVEADRFGDAQLYLAAFSCHGPQISCGAPGVGIVSTVPPTGDDPAPYAEMTGTSVSSPAVTGMLAAMLAQHPDFKSLPRDNARSATARRALTVNTKDLGLERHYQGEGIPTLPT